MADGTTPSHAPLSRYRQKRDFKITPEPSGGAQAKSARRGRPLSFVVQKHWASSLHYDVRLELDRVLLSWAVPKGPSFDPADKRMAIHVEDHPVSYGGFEGTIPPKQYGAGKVIVWDKGTWEPVGDAHEGMQTGKLAFRLHGQKLAGLWELVRISKPGDKQDRWILFKKRDEWARPSAGYDVVAAPGGHRRDQSEARRLDRVGIGRVAGEHQARRRRREDMTQLGTVGRQQRIGGRHGRVRNADPDCRHRERQVLEVVVGQDRDRTRHREAAVQ